MQDLIKTDTSTQTVTKRQGTSRADAQLIAAAPDLLAALEVLLAHHKVYDTTSDTLQDRVADARAAIAKATGK